MYDPTIFENLKVAFENRVYDLTIYRSENNDYKPDGSDGFCYSY